MPTLTDRLQVEQDPAVSGLTRRTDPNWRKLVNAFHAAFAGPHVPRFELELPDGALHPFGGQPTNAVERNAEGARFSIRVRTQKGVRALLSFDEARIAEAFLNSDFDVDGDLLSAFDLRKFFADCHPFQSVWRFIPPLFFGQVTTDKKGIPRHYDYGDEFYFSFLDKDVRLYSQALYRSEHDTLEQAARNKLDYILDACRLTEGTDVLDVGAGWGSFSCYAAARGVNVTMMTLAHKQYECLTNLARNSSAPGRLDAVRESIYAYAPRKRFDAIVLLGVMEHLPDYGRLCRQFDALLKPNGRVYMDFSAIRKKYASSSVAYRHVFPGNHSPVVLPELLAAANASTFEPIAVHNDRHSYFLTLSTWARNLEAARDRLLPEFGERTFRLFQLYLWATAHALGCDGSLQSYRVVIQKSRGSASTQLGFG
jgi:cyclopropane-fatty-acyl-phospholipid synthase